MKSVFLNVLIKSVVFAFNCLQLNCVIKLTPF